MVGILHPVNNTTLDDICACVGFTATTVLQAWYGGRSIRLPDRLTADWGIAHLVGSSAARALWQRFRVELGMERLTIPNGAEARRYERNVQIARMLADGATLPEVGRRFRITLRQVQNLRRDLVADGWLWYDAATGGARLPRGRAGSIQGAKIFGTSEVFQEPPPPSAEGLAPRDRTPR